MHLSVLLLLMVISSPVFCSLCASVDWDKTVKVKLVNDGDTITLMTNKRVRLIGVNAPEINYRHLEKSDPYALKAKKLLQRYVKKGDVIHLVFDRTRRDKYGRTLAYVYSKSGRNLAALLLQSGYAKQWVIGKNDRFWQCLQQAESKARKSKKGVWSRFKPLSAKKLTWDDKGYQYIRGSISNIVENKKGLEFTLDRRLTVRISAANLKKFTDRKRVFRKNERVTLTGKIRFSGKQAYLTLYHPVQLFLKW